MDEKLERLRKVSRYYKVDGDLMVCRECNSRIIASNMLVPMKHNDDRCKTPEKSDIVNPWYVMTATLEGLKTDIADEAFRAHQRKLHGDRNG